MMVNKLVLIMVMVMMVNKLVFMKDLEWQMMVLLQ